MKMTLPMVDRHFLALGWHGGLAILGLLSSLPSASAQHSGIDLAVKPHGELVTDNPYLYIDTLVGAHLDFTSSRCISFANNPGITLGTTSSTGGIHVHPTHEVSRTDGLMLVVITVIGVSGCVNAWRRFRLTSPKLSFHFS